MLTREDFIGTVLDDQFIIVGVAGEGAEGVVFKVATLDNPTECKSVIKMYKPLAFLEMGVLHHSFKIYEPLYPNHPLKMSEEKRMALLKAEMLERLNNLGSIYRLGDLMKFYNLTIEIIAREYYSGYRNGSLVESFLNANSAIEIFTDNVLAQLISEFMENDQIESKYLEFFEFIGECLAEKIESNSLKDHTTLCNSILSKLLGLNMAGFISKDETMAISHSQEFIKLIKHGDLSVLFNLITAFHSYAISLSQNLPEKKESTKLEGDFDFSNYEYESIITELDKLIKSGMLGCELLVDVSLSNYLNSLESAGLGYLWYSYFLEFYSGDDANTNCIMSLSEAAKLFEDTKSYGNLHDTYNILAKKTEKTDSNKAKEYLSKAIEAEKKFYNKNSP